MKRTIVFALMAMALTSARADVVINTTNFPDPVLRAALVDCGIDDGDGVLTDEEIENATDYIHLEGCKNLKGLEYLKNMKFIGLYGNEESYSSITSFDASKFTKLERLDIHDYAITSLDATYSTMLGLVDIAGCREFTSIKVDTQRDDLGVYLKNLPKLTSMENCVFNHVSYVEFYKTGIQDIDMSDHPTLESLCVKGDDKGDYELNSINVSGCNNLWDLNIDHVKLQSVRLNALPRFYDISLYFCHTTNLALENMANLGGITCSGCEIQNLTIKGCPVLHGVSCADNSLHNLIIDDSPGLYSLHLDNNMLMWLDMSNVKKEVDDQTYWYSANNQHPSVQAVKLSPTETGLLVHDRFDVSRVLDLKAKGLAQTPRETTVDGIRYFVFYDNGPDTPNLVGSDCGYVYDTKWPYTWKEGSENTKDNNLPVTLKVTSWTKHQAFLKLSESTVRGKYAEPAPAAPTVTRSQDYDGKITFKSSNEKVVKVNPDTGELTVIGAGTATITVSGEETDYRLAPTTSYKVIIDKASPVFSFATRSFETTYGGDPIPANALDIQMYDGTVVYTVSPDSVATVDSNGKVTIVGAGTATIYATGPETSNCYRAQTTYTVKVNKAHTTFAFQIDSIAVNVGDSLKLNQLNVGIYDGVVVYTSSDDSIASVSADGYVKANCPGEVIITASGPETYNCFEAASAQYKLTIVLSGASVNKVGMDESDDVMYDLLGRRIEGQPLRKGIYIKDGKKILVD